jgi:hypothetical protein
MPTNCCPREPQAACENTICLLLAEALEANLTAAREFAREAIIYIMLAEAHTRWLRLSRPTSLQSPLLNTFHDGWIQESRSIS